MKLAHTNWLSIIFIILFVTDISFIILHILYLFTDLISNPDFSIDQDRGYSEIFQYLKEYWIALLLGFLAARERSWLYFSWSLLFFYLLADDFAQIHENLGDIISKRLAFSPIANLRTQDLGELLVSAAVGTFFLIFIGTAYHFGDRNSRKVTKTLIKLLFVLAFFGIAVDIIHVTLNSPSLDYLLGIIEDGGELIAMSAIASYVFFLYENWQSNKQPRNVSEPELTAVGLKNK